VDLDLLNTRFDIPGTFLKAAPYGAGHINDTFLGEYDQEGRRVRYVHQRINRKVFPNPVAIMENIHRVVEHLRGKMASRPPVERERRILTLVPARNGASFWTDDGGEIWRTYRFIEGARSLDVPESPRQVYEAARAFAGFQRMLMDLPGPPLGETIPHFHDTPRRLEALRTAISGDLRKRGTDARMEIEFALGRQDLAVGLLRLKEQGRLGERGVHNDTKLNNVLLDERTGEGLCVIDLDTVMPGLGPWDFGDLVRSAANPASEDERDLAQVKVDTTLFEAIARGYLEELGALLSEAERASLVLGAKVITLECGARFLTDHLEGDRYFKVARSGQNLDRCRVQFALLRSFEAQEEELERIVESCSGAG